LDPKKDLKKIDQARKILLAEIDEAIKKGKANDKALDELNKHLIQVSKYKRVVVPSQHPQSRRLSLSGRRNEVFGAGCKRHGRVIAAMMDRPDWSVMTRVPARSCASRSAFRSRFLLY
jgi:uncharacterized protein YggU (UPF0235/DUF167 family)